MATTFTAIRAWADMVKFSHSIFALPFALTAAFLAGRNLPDRLGPYPGQLVLIVMCMIAARSVAMTFNRIVDAQIDARNPRTANRPLPSGRLSLAAAWTLLAIAAVTFGIGCAGFYAFFGNSWPILFSGPVLLYLCGYSFAKRFTRWSHFYLGSALALSPAACWIAIHPPSLGWPTLWLMVAVTGWVGGFDIIYACQDIAVDRREGLHSLPSRLGPVGALWIARAAHAMAAAALILVGITAGLGPVYAVGVLCAVVLLVVENTLVRADDFSRINLAFFTINGMVSLIFGACAIGDVLLCTAR